MEYLAADGTAVCLVGPFAQAGVVQHVAAGVDFGYVLVVDMVWAVLLGLFGEDIRILNGKEFVVDLVLLQLCCIGGRTGLDVQRLQTDDALISHGRWLAPSKTRISKSGVEVLKRKKKSISVMNWALIWQPF
jgi:hypothetical protein